MLFKFSCDAKSALSCGALLLAAGAVPALQAEPLYHSWYWHAFASQTGLYTSDNRLYGDSDDSVSSDLREVGILVGGQPFEKLQLVAQVLSRKAGDQEDGDPRLDYGFAGYSFYSDLDGSLGVKVGRVRSPFGFLNETRDVAHTRASILLPQAVYIDRLRNLFFARDGVLLYGSHQYDMSSLSWDLTFGRIEVREDDYPEVVGFVDLAGEVDIPFTPLVRVIWDWDMGRVRLGLTHSNAEVDYDAAPVDVFSSGKQKTRNWVLSTEYNEAAWSLTSELSLTKHKMSNFVPGMHFDSDGYGYYVQGVYRFAPGWDVLARWDEQYSSKDKKDDWRTFSKDLTLGVGWRPDSNWLLRGEWHLIDGTSRLSVRENAPQDLQRHWQMVLFQISYRI